MSPVTQGTAEATGQSAQEIHTHTCISRYLTMTEATPATEGSGGGDELESDESKGNHGKLRFKSSLHNATNLLDT